MSKLFIIVILVALAIMSALYGFVIGAIKSGTKFFLVWFGVAAFFVVLAIGFYTGMWHKLPLLFQRIFQGIFWLGVFSFAIIEGCIISKWKMDGKENLDYIIVLGAQVRADGPSVVLKHRLNRSLTYMHENPKTICIVSGGQGYNEPFSEAEGMARYLEEHGISVERIVKENQSKTTEQNISYSMNYINRGSTIGLVTNNFHMFRALQIAKDQRVKHIYGISADSSLFYMPNNMFREYLAEIKYLFRKVVTHLSG